MVPYRSAGRTGRLTHRLQRLLAVAILMGACGDPVRPPDAAQTPQSPQPPLPPTNPPSPPPSRPLAKITGRIAFASTRDGSAWIYVADSTSVRRLVRGDEPAWSPDGATIAFRSPDGISLMSGDGTNVRLVRKGGTQPAWSPDGKQITFTDGGLRVMHADGASERLLVSNDFHQQGDEIYRPDWSTDGQRIAFMLYDCCWMWPVEIWVVGLDGAPPTKVIDGVPSGTGRRWVSLWAPAWSPDGKSLAFIYQSGISTIVLGVEYPNRLAATAAYESDLAWSPDGRSLVYSEYSTVPSGENRLPVGPLRLYTLDVVTGKVRQLLPEASPPSGREYSDNHAVWAR
jgi:Tol biopolymer transport system component